MSRERVAHAWHTLKTTLEYVHLAYFLAHIAHSDILAFLVLVVTPQLGWIMIAALGASYALTYLRNAIREVHYMPKPEQEPANHQPSPTAPEPELTITTPNVPHTLAELARAGVHVKITIELKPSR